MEELTKRDYPIGVLENLIGSRGKQAVDRKLTKYGYGFSSAGSGTKRVYTITSLPNAQARFKSYCVHGGCVFTEVKTYPCPCLFIRLRRKNILPQNYT